MKTIRAIIVGCLVWILGASFYTASYFIPILDNMELQANLVLAIALIPNAWLGARIFYRKGAEMHGLKLGTLVVITAIILDAIITVPFFILPKGGNYQDFFGAPAFWLIVIEYMLVILSYYHFKVRQRVIPA